MSDPMEQANVTAEQLLGGILQTAAPQGMSAWAGDAKWQSFSYGFYSIATT